MALDTFDPNCKQKDPAEGHQDVATEVIRSFPTVVRPAGYDELVGLAVRLRMAIGTETSNAFNLVKSDIEARVAAGAHKYGRRLQTNNGRDVIVDLYQEVLDAINYFKQAQMEGRL